MEANSLLISNSGAVAVGGFTTAALGFVYWWLAARSFPPAAVGIASAQISIMGLLAAMGEVGLGTLLIGETLRQKSCAHGLIMAALVAGFVGSAAFGLAYFAAEVSLFKQLDSVAGTLLTGSLVIGGCAVTGFAQVLDQAFIGLLRSTLQMYRNVVFSLIKLLLLLAAAATGFSSLAGGTVIVGTWVAAAAASAVLLGGLAWLNKIISLSRPDFTLLSRLAPKVIDHHLLNLATQVPILILPLLVTVILSPEANAAFYPAWMILNIAFLAPVALTTVLYTVGVADPRSLARRMMFSLRASTIFALATAFVFFLLSEFILGLFNPAYPEIAGSSLQFLGFGLLGMSVKQHYIALIRLKSQTRKTAGYFAFAGLLELTLAAAGGQAAGLRGLTLGWILAILIEAALMLKPILAVTATSKSTGDVAKHHGKLELG
jgi:O-antigen/teichoic acid export membrane protein